MPDITSQKLLKKKDSSRNNKNKMKCGKIKYLRIILKKCVGPTWRKLQNLPRHEGNLEWMERQIMFWDGSLDAVKMWNFSKLILDLTKSQSKSQGDSGRT